MTRQRCLVELLLILLPMSNPCLRQKPLLGWEAKVNTASAMTGVVFEHHEEDD